MDSEFPLSDTDSDDSDTLANASELKRGLLWRSCKELADILEELANSSPDLHQIIETKVRDLAQREEDASRKSQQKFEAKAKWLQAPFDHDALLKRVGNLLEEPECPTSGSKDDEEYQRTLKRHIKTIDRTLLLMVEHCRPTTPSALRQKSLSTMLKVLEYIVDMERVTAMHDACVASSQSWRWMVLVDFMWFKLDEDSKYKISTSTDFYQHFLMVNLKWEEETGERLPLKNVALMIRWVVRKVERLPDEVDRRTGELLVDGRYHYPMVSKVLPEDLTIADFLDYEEPLLRDDE